MRGPLDDIKRFAQVANTHRHSHTFGKTDGYNRARTQGRKNRMQQHTRHLVIVGHVQGVGFRYAMVMKAAEIGITGWVRNRQDGTVEAVVQGLPDAVEAVTEWARHGPPGATVTDVQIAEGFGEYVTFETRPTA